MTGLIVYNPTGITVVDSATAAIRDRLIPPLEANKNARSRLQHFVHWLEQNATTWREWLIPDLSSYAQYAMSNQRSGLNGETIAPLSARSTNAHLSTIRGQYEAIRSDRNLIYDFVPKYDEHGKSYDPANRRAMAEELLDRLAGALSPKRVKVKEVTQQDRVDSQHVRLTQRQAEELIAAPYNRKQSELKKLRDSALFALMLATGIREDEAVNLRVSDLRQHKEGELVLLVRKGKGSKQRTVPYGNNDGVLLLVDRWLDRSGISRAAGDPFVFSAFKSVKSSAEEINPTKHMTTRSLQRTLALYPVTIDGHKRRIAPHDLRRTYARREHDAGTPLTAIQQNLGHSDIKTTMGYIGDLDFKQRRGRAAYNWQGLIPAA